MLKSIFFDSWGCLRAGWFMLIITAATLLIVSALVGVIVYGLHKAGEKDCSVYAEVTNRKTNFRFMECYVLSGQEWMPRSEFEKRAVTNE